ncbi:hypothetical protein [Acuticoccus kandeliae]|uniref:hypothetical protein n=1 Tax=Acuticoccus kandeliae TaxID=2073160 RepID=UPI0013005D54|nr:hypothetical protein [Acuticoccus kandeliae]
MSADEVLQSFEADLAEADSEAAVEKVSTDWADEINRAGVMGKARKAKAARAKELGSE